MTSRGPQLVLGSGSPRRREILERAGIAFQVLAPDGDGPSRAAAPDVRVLDHARYKAAAVADVAPGRWVLAADTLVFQDGRFYPKPADRREAEEMLRSLSGAVHEVWTGVVLRSPDGRCWERADRARVRFRAITGRELREYLAGDEWVDKAGAYGFQGEAGRWAKVESGDPETVIGLSSATVRALLADAGVGSEAASG